ncbi:hypothetical protein [Nonomuraea sp. NPDC001699]
MRQLLAPAAIGVRCDQDRVELVCEATLSQAGERDLIDARLEAADLDYQDAPLVLTAVRAHLQGPHPGPPLVAWEAAEPLAEAGAIEEPGPYAAGKLVRLHPHPDLLYALGFADRPCRRSRRR